MGGFEVNRLVNQFKLAATGGLAALILIGYWNRAIAENESRNIADDRVAQDNIKIPKGMVRIPGGIYAMGVEGAHGDESPVHPVALKPFFMDRHEVTNEEFAEFVKATDFVTQAEKDGYAWCYLKDESDFRSVIGASWLHPEGPGSDIQDRLNHPVVCVSWDDARAYAEWAGKRLPTEAEWEYVSRAGGKDHLVADISKSYLRKSSAESGSHQHQSHSMGSNDLSPSAKAHQNGMSPGPNIADDKLVRVRANIWQGTWPLENALADGYFYTAPAGQFPANEWNVHDMLGNVWEWTSDWYDEQYYQVSPKENPSGPETGELKVARGGSWFCSPNYCGAYSTYFRGASPPDHAFNNVGFRCAADIPTDYGSLNKE
jgi:formylglycine-generating enzyme required for sulfatase activity